MAQLQRDQVAGIWLARRPADNKDYIRAGVLDTTDATRSNLAQWHVQVQREVGEATQRIRVHHRKNSRKNIQVEVQR